MKIGRESEKKILVPNSVPTRPGLENSKKKEIKFKKLKKTSFRRYFYPIRDDLGREREKKKFSPEFRSNPILARILKKK